MQGAIVLTHSEFDRQKFLDRDKLIEICIMSEISDPKTTLPQNRFDSVPVQFVPRFKGITGRRQVFVRPLKKRESLSQIVAQSLRCYLSIERERISFLAKRIANAAGH